MKRNLALLATLLMVLPVYSMDIALQDLARELQNLADLLSGNVPPPTPYRPPVRSAPSSSSISSGSATGNVPPPTPYRAPAPQAPAPVVTPAAATPSPAAPPLPPRTPATPAAPAITAPVAPSVAQPSTPSGSTAAPSNGTTATVSTSMADILKRRATMGSGTTISVTQHVKKSPELPKENLDVSLTGIKNQMDLKLADYTVDLQTGKIKFDKNVPQIKENAKAILVLLQSYVAKNDQKIKQNPNVQQSLHSMLERIAYTDPLLISSVVALLQKIGINRDHIYDFILNLYEHRVKYVETEFNAVVDRVKKAATGFVIPKGTAEDLDEGLSYAFELAGLVADAENAVKLKGDQQAQRLVDGITQREQRLLDLLKSISAAQKKQLIDAGIPVDDYIQMLQREPMSWCVIAQAKGFVPFYQHLNIILGMIQEYETKPLKRSQKIARLQSIMNRLNGFVEHAVDANFCSTCLDYETLMLKIMNVMPDSQKAVEQIKSVIRPEQSAQLTAKDVVKYDQAFKNIEAFLQKVNQQEQSARISTMITTTLAQLKKIIEDGCRR